MNITSKIIETYKSFTSIPTLVAAQITSKNVVNSVWTQRNIEKGKPTKFQRSILVLNDLKEPVETHPVDISEEVLTSTSASEQFRAVLKEQNSKQFLEVWQKSSLIRCVNLNELDVHGNVYSDIEFSSFEWSPDEKKILYVAEKKVPKSDPYHKRITEKPSEEGDGDTPKPRGEEYVFTEDWGEQLVGKKKSILAQYDIENDKVEILSGIPDDKCIAQPKYSPDGSHIIGVSYSIEPRRLGLIYCSNRDSTLFTLDFEGNYVELGLEKSSVKSPRFTPDGKTIIWLQRSAGGPHASAMALKKTQAPLKENSTIETVVEIVETSIKIENNKTFYGLYNTGFPKRCWADNCTLLLSTNQKYTANSYLVNIDTGKITELSINDNSSLIVLDVFQDNVLVAKKHALKPDQLAIGKLPVGKKIETAINFTNLTEKTVPELEKNIVEFLDFKVDGDEVDEFNAIYIGPSEGKDASVPLIVWPHGGPHSAFANTFMMEAAMFLSFNLGCLLVNYRGSIGCGVETIRFLSGKIGMSDVSDCIQAVDDTLKRFSWLKANSVSLFGGSHGGFIVALLSSRYPDRFRSVVARNPVTDLPSKIIISDAPDTSCVSLGQEYNMHSLSDKKLLIDMANRSPIRHSNKVKSPTLLFLGTEDLRVPFCQGREYYYRLLANGVKTRLHLYKDNHKLAKVPHEMDLIINTVLWILEHN
ncbi:acylamino-acid-releasing enzyme-like isoform X2 [Aethina tumida]|uniref:acylamino-acid-releasing enzyme-like isoform X2 n=2 Tax=Aethina tumida TaxID=116153 RepID=UPI0021480892|nr:acylamino-acid-releasing enzyme-like isoform X2 [Aethina tumida]